ncbi:MAG TPA: LysM peptidoglycan-binding domain-containing protein [Thermoanaerobaculia bacterium]|nr:LysM peptidoglycan-binding domain-containing protein [Thermoanaerobaculia bacterium]
MPALAQPKSSSRPPRELHLVGEHWTAYNPPDPASYPPAAKTHTVKRGDTLWGIAKTYYGNAYLWPQLWESNTWVTDAHWIYPGDVLLVEGEASQAAVTDTTSTSTTSRQAELSGGTSENEDTQARTTPMAQITPVSRPIPLATEFDIYCYGYIGDPNEPMPNYIESLEDVEIMYTPRLPTDRGAAVAAGDLVFVHGGAETGLVAGETYLLVEPSDVVTHPATGATLGRKYEYAGQIRVLCLEGNRARAMITQACREVNVGARLKPMPQLPIPIARIPDLPPFCETPSGKTSGYIVDSRGWDLGIAEGTLVQVDLGTENSVQPGDFLTVYRPSQRADQPRQVLGEIGILTTQARTATGVIVAMRRTMAIGDQVELR